MVGAPPVGNYLATVNAFDVAAWLGLLLPPGLLTLLADTLSGGTPDPWTARRRQMVREQLSAPGRDLANARVLAVMGRVPRHEFVPEDQRAAAYEDRALPIGYGQTISQPYIVGLMTELLAPQPGDRVLEIGTGSGYQAAVLSALVHAVFTIEIVAPLAHRAAAALQRVGAANVFGRLGDGHPGWPEAAPFDAIIVTCAPDNVPPLLVKQLKDGGRIVIPIGPLDGQVLVLLRKNGQLLERTTVLPVRFVPMTGATPPQDSSR